ncbi:cell wall metabolism sensor histidine kinase WalK [Acidaminobacter sp. JC074]|uniref:sensor histidine kinase n=1 Tax=Acidaminobacter sp. JC074 TaxID=2530199 RepID=UPI001F0F8B3C|nr:HAMP domain-containing sensor histidine kinase [Acidaminobacter sp. JC074]
MNKTYVRSTVIVLIFIAMIVSFINQTNQLAYVLLGVLLLSLYLLWGDLKDKKDLKEVLSSLNHFSESKKTKKILVHGDSTYKDLILKLNMLYEAYETIDVEKRVQAERSKQLLSNLSHDIRTPLTSIIGYVDALNDGVITDEEELKEFFEILSMKSKNLKHLTEQIFNVARIDAEDVMMAFEYLELNEFLRNIVIDFIPQFEKYEIDFINEIKEVRYMVYADKIALTRVFQNILKNAIQHGKDGKVIGVRTRIENTYYRVIIWDKGKGIPKAKQQHIFERLFKVDDARKFGASNSGLGMSIAKKIVLKHNGRIDLKSQENQLTEFFVELPILKELKI